METLWHDLRYGIRMLLKCPGFTAVAVITLALGIGANTAIFSVVNAVVLRPLPYPEPNQIVRLWEYFGQDATRRTHISAGEFVDYRERNRSFQGVAAFILASASLTGVGDPERLSAAVTSVSFFPILGVQPILGRTFLPEEEQLGRNNAVVLSFGLWQRRFGADAKIIGQTLTLNGRPRTVVGVMPPSFRYPEGADLWLPLVLTPEMLRPERRHSRSLEVIARVKPGVTIQQADAEMKSIVKDFPAQPGVTLIPLHQQVVGDVQLALVVILGAVTFLLLIACANVADLLLARATAREREIAIRAALGASRFRLVRQLLTESALLAIIGGAAGLMLAAWGIDVLRWLSPQNLPRLDEVAVDGPVLGFTVLVAILTGAIFGLAPSLSVARTDLQLTLKEGSRTSIGSPRQRLRGLLVVSEVALSLVLLIGAGLMIQSFIRLMRVNPGFHSENVLTMQLTLPGARYQTPAQRVGFYGQLLERVRGLPGVQAAGAVSDLPLSGVNVDRSFLPADKFEEYLRRTPSADFRHATADYFRAMSIPLLAGRSFTEQDGPEALRVGIVNETLAHNIWPGENAVGKQIRFHTGRDWTEELTVVGVIGDIKHHGLDTVTRNEIYVPFEQVPISEMFVAVRTSADPMQQVGAVRAAVQGLDKDLPLFNVRSMEELFGRSVAERRFQMLLHGVFSLLALVLASVGIYGVMSYSVAERTHEFGIRLALGAGQRDVLKLVIGQGMILVLMGVSVGLGAALALTRLIATMLYSVSATDPMTFAIVSLLLATVALVACYVPARRATKVDPLVALRYE